MTLIAHILFVLDRADADGIAEPVLRDELHTRLRRRPGVMELQDELAALVAEGFAEARVQTLTKDTRWFITDAGRREAK